MNQYYYNLNGQQVGPVTKLELMNLRNMGRINDATLVWAQGMPQWAPYATAMAQGTPGMPQVKPNNGMVGAILATLFCCLPFGIVAIVKASSVDNLWMAGQYEAAKQAAKSAKDWTMWSVLGSLIGVALYALMILFAAAGA